MKKMKEVNYIFYMVLVYSFSCLYGNFYKNKIADILKIENINLGYLGIFIILVISYLFLFVKHNKTMEDIVKLTTKSLLIISVVLIGVNYPTKWLIGLMIYMIMISIALFIPRENIKELNNTELYPSRRNLMEVLNHALGEYSLIALDGTWGSGKTTFMNIFMRENREKFHYIPVNVMLFENRNSLKTEFLNQLKGIFKEEGIFQGSLMDFDYYLDGVSNDWVNMVKNIIFSKSKSFKEANEKLKNEIKKIDKKIVVGVDNLERIYGESEPEWKQILGFIHELQELGMKIVVMANLEEMLTTKKETGEKDLSNHEYFDKFYEFKLKLNEVTTEEIIEEINFYDNNLFKKMLKNELKELIDNLDMGFSIKEDVKEIEETKDQYKELLTRYQNSVKNPRKMIKIVKNIENKKKTIKNIYKFIDDDEYEKLIFKASMFSLVYFDYMNEIKKEEFDDFIKDKKIRIENFFGYYFKDIGLSFRGLNRLLHYDVEDDGIKKRIENLNVDKINNTNDIEKTLKDLRTYDDRLDPDFDQETTKGAYKIIEEKIIELEKIEKEKIYEIIKENEEFICKMNYLCYPNEVGIHEKVNFKFKIESKHQERGLLNIYYQLLNELDIIINKSDFNVARKEALMGLIGFRNTILIFSELTKQPNLSFKEILELYDKHSEEFTINDIEKLKNAIESRVKSDYVTEKVENIIFERLLNLLNILKVNLTRSNVIIKSNKILEDLEKYGEKKDENEKIKFLAQISWRIREEKEILNSKEMQKINDSLNKVIEGESNPKLLFELNGLKNNCDIFIFPKQIKEKSEEILKKIQEDEKEKIDEMKKELLVFINDKIKELRWQYIFNGSWSEYLKKLTEIGIKVDQNENSFNAREN